MNKHVLFVAVTILILAGTGLASQAFATTTITIETGGALWSQDGMYTISAHQGAASNYQTSADVEIVDGHVIPEFGTIAVMILAVAIVSIIIVTGRSKLGLVQRY